MEVLLNSLPNANLDLCRADQLALGARFRRCLENKEVVIIRGHHHASWGSVMSLIIVISNNGMR